MSVRQDVFNYMKEKPGSSLDQVLNRFADLKASTVRRYFFEYQKSGAKENTAKKKRATSPQKTTKKTSPNTQKGKISVKQQVFDFMQAAPEAKLKELTEAFPKCAKNTLGNYRRQWLKDNSPANEPISKTKMNEIFSYLDNNPGSNINDLKKIFPEVANKLVTVFRSWKNNQSAESETETSSISQSIKSKAQSVKENLKPSEGWLEKHKDTIAKQKEIIERQKNKIEALKSQLPKFRRPTLIDSIKKFIINKLSKDQ